MEQKLVTMKVMSRPTGDGLPAGSRTQGVSQRMKIYRTKLFKETGNFLTLELVRYP